MKFSEKTDGLFYLFIASLLLSFSFYSVYHAFHFEQWGMLLLAIFLCLFAITLALYGSFRRLNLYKKKKYQRVYRFYLFSQLLSFLYLILAGCILSFYLNYTYGFFVLILGISATVICLLALYYSLKKEEKNKPEIG